MIHFYPIIEAHQSICKTNLEGKLYSTNEALVECVECRNLLGLDNELESEDILDD